MLNVVCLMGRLVADPELRHTQSQIPVTSFRIAVDRTYPVSYTHLICYIMNMQLRNCVILSILHLHYITLFCNCQRELLL